MNVLEIIKVVLYALAGFIPPVSAFIVAIKKWKSTRAEKDLLEVVNGFIAVAEQTFSGLDLVMKAQGASAGSVKKENVMTKLQAYAMEKGYKIDLDYWSTKIDEIVAFTREVNAQKKADQTA